MNSALLSLSLSLKACHCLQKEVDVREDPRAQNTVLVVGESAPRRSRVRNPTISFLCHLARERVNLNRYSGTSRYSGRAITLGFAISSVPRAGTLYAPPGENNIEITGLHAVVIAVGVVAVGSRRRRK